MKRSLFVSRFSVVDVVQYSDYFENPERLREEMLKSEKWQVLLKRGAGRNDFVERPEVRFLPHSTSKENELFAKQTLSRQ